MEQLLGSGAPNTKGEQTLVTGSVRGCSNLVSGRAGLKKFSLKVTCSANHTRRRAIMAVAQDVDMIREQERLFNFLKKYSLHQYYQKFLLKGVHRLNHLKDVCGDDASLDEIGLSRIERQRLKKKVKENVEWRGRIVVGLASQSQAPVTCDCVNIVS